MSMIVPAGNRKVDWVPEDKSELVKTASTEEAPEEPKDELLEAAKAVLEAREKNAIGEEAELCACGCGMSVAECPGKVEGEGEVVVEVADEAIVPEEEAEVIEDAAEEVEDVVEEVAAEQVSEAVEKIEEAVEEVKDAIGDVSEVHEQEDAGEAEEVIIDVEEPAVEEVAVVEEEVPGVMEEDQDPEVEKEGAGCIAEDEEETVEKEASASAEEFQKFAKLSPSNRQKIADYWKQTLGYPSDYVDLMTKDYEK